MRSLYVTLAAVVVAVAAAWQFAFQPRLELASSQLDHAYQQLAASGLLDRERVAVIEVQAEQLSVLLENEIRNRELLAQIAHQGRAHSAALQELKHNDKQIMDYLDQPVPVELGRLYQRTATTDPGAYRQSAKVPTDVVPASGASNATGER